MSFSASAVAAGLDRDFDQIDDMDDNCVQHANTDQRDTDLDGYGNVCDGDFDNNGTTSVQDLTLLSAAWNTSVGQPGYNPDADMNGDGVVGITDFLLFKQFYLKAPGPSALPCRGSGVPCPKPNLLFVVIDDIGVDKVGSYDGPPGLTPAIDALAADGMQFTNAWASPSCSAMRAAALTGRYSFRTGIASATRRDNPDEFGLATDHPSIAKTLGAAGYATAAIGKWHLSSWCVLTNAVGGCDAEYDLTHPIDLGFDYFEGTLGNIAGTDYCTWPKLTASRNPDTGEISTVSWGANSYATRETADDAIAHIPTMPEPWLAWVAFNSAHTPYHNAPIGDPGSPCSMTQQGTQSNRHDTMVINLDSEIARLLASLSPTLRARTLIIVIGDNGTPKTVMHPPQEIGGKRSLYETGIRVPLVVTGPMITKVATGSTSASLVSVVDFFATFAELADSSDTSDDSVSFLDTLVNPIVPTAHTTLYSERFDPNGPGPYDQRTQAIRGTRFKLIRFLEGLVPPHFEAYDLLLDPTEQNDLMPLTPSQRVVFEPLAAELAQLLGDPCISLDDPEASCPGS